MLYLGLVAVEKWRSMGVATTLSLGATLSISLMVIATSGVQAFDEGRRAWLLHEGRARCRCWAVMKEILQQSETSNEESGEDESFGENTGLEDNEALGESDRLNDNKGIAVVEVIAEKNKPAYNIGIEYNKEINKYTVLSQDTFNSVAMEIGSICETNTSSEILDLTDKDVSINNHDLNKTPDVDANISSNIDGITTPYAELILAPDLDTSSDINREISTDRKHPSSVSTCDECSDDRSCSCSVSTSDGDFGQCAMYELAMLRNNYGPRASDLPVTEMSNRTDKSAGDPSGGQEVKGYSDVRTAPLADNSHSAMKDGFAIDTPSTTRNCNSRNANVADVWPSTAAYPRLTVFQPNANLPREISAPAGFGSTGEEPISRGRKNSRASEYLRPIDRRTRIRGDDDVGLLDMMTSSRRRDTPTRGCPEGPNKRPPRRPRTPMEDGPKCSGDFGDNGQSSYIKRPQYNEHLLRDILLAYNSV